MKEQLEKKLSIKKIDNLFESRYFFEQRYSRAIPVFIFLIVLIFMIVIFWALFAKMDDVVKAQAILRPIENISVIKSLTSGEIITKKYSQDQFVQEGELLLCFDIDADTIDLNNSKNNLAQIVQDYNNFLIVEQTIIQNKNIASKNNNDAWILCETYIAESLRFLQEKDQILLKLNREKELPKNLQIENKIVDIESEIIVLDKHYISWRNRELVNVQEKIKNLEQLRQTKERRISDLERNIKSATIYAPISGHIDETQKINIGDFILAGEEIFRIIPESSSSLKAEIVLDPSSIARIKKGQIVKLRFPSLPPSRFGQLEGYISLIPADVKIVGNSAYFFVEAEIPQPFLLASNGEHIQLRSGISAEGRIIIDNDTIFRMMLRKLDFLQ